MNISTYKGPRYNYKTVITVNNGKSYTKGFKEAVIYCNRGQLWYNITDGYKTSIDRPIRNNLKSAINIIEGKIK